MRTELIDGEGLRTFVAVLDKGDEAVSCLTGLAEQEGIQGASLTAIGAFSQVTVGYFDREARSYQEIPVDEQVEVLTLVGDFAVANGEPKLHAHVVLGHRDGTTTGGHLLEGRVWPTLEVVLTEVPARLVRRTDPETGLPLLDLGRSG